MKNLIAIIVIAASFVSGVCRAELKPGATELNSVEKRLDLLIKQNQSLIAENSALKERCDKPKTKEEVFAACMQAAKGGNSAMAAESIGIRCEQLLKN